MSQIEAPAIATAVIRTIVVPASLYHAVTRANMSLMDLLVFGKLRKVASIEDVATFAALNDNLFINGHSISTCKLKDAVSLGDGNRAEFAAIFGAMASNPEITKLALQAIEEVADPFSYMLAMQVAPGAAVTVPDRSLANTQGTSLTRAADSTYQLKTSGSNVFVVVGNGFSKYVGATRNKEASDLFIREFLKLCTRLYSPQQVARHPLFKTFLHSLAG